jgi:hypothetical protein
MLPSWSLCSLADVRGASLDHASRALSAQTPVGGGRPAGGEPPPGWVALLGGCLRRSYRRNRLKMRLLMRGGRCAGRRSGQRPRRGRLSQPLAKRENPRHCRGSPDGASRTRTGDLLGEIQGAQRLNVPVLQGVSGGKRQSTSRKSSAICGSSQEFWQVAASAWQTSDGYRDGSARRGEEARAIPANDNAVAERKQASEEVGRAHSSLVRNRRLAGNSEAAPFMRIA